ncbi:melanoma-associated antigen 10-like [Hipposideros larvatus]
MTSGHLSSHICSTERRTPGPDKIGGPQSEGLDSDIICVKTSDLVNFLLLKFRAKEPTTKAEMLSKVIGEHADHFPEIFRHTTDCLQLIYGVDVNEVDPINNAYVLGTVLDLTYDGSSESGIPKTGLLVMVLCAIAMEGGCAPEHKVWEALNNVGVHDGMEHYMFGDPRELITKVLVEEQYLEYRQVTDSDPARYEFLWGPRAHAETTNLKILEFLNRPTADPGPCLMASSPSPHTEPPDSLHPEVAIKKVACGHPVLWACED